MSIKTRREGRDPSLPHHLVLCVTIEKSHLDRVGRVLRQGPCAKKDKSRLPVCIPHGLYCQDMIARFVRGQVEGSTESSIYDFFFTYEEQQHLESFFLHTMCLCLFVLQFDTL